jgi:hypothetical protein
MQIAGLFMLAAWMGTESLMLPALVLLLFIYSFWRYWRWWRRRRDAGVIDLDAGKFD